MAIKVNSNNVVRYFQIKKRLRQGVPLSLMILNIVADMFAVIIERAKIDSQIKGVILDGGLYIFNMLMIQFCL
jgi:hypothetical protein